MTKKYIFIGKNGTTFEVTKEHVKKIEHPSGYKESKNGLYERLVIEDLMELYNKDKGLKKRLPNMV